MRFAKLIFILISIVIMVSALVLLNNNPKDKVLNCLQLKSGNVVLKLNYSDIFVSESYEESGLVRISLRNSDHNTDYILGIDPLNYYAPIEEIINNSLIEPGPKYQKSIFNGYEAGYYHIENADQGILDQYEIPFGNRNFYIFYQLSSLTEEEKFKAEEMLNSVKFSQNNEDVLEPYVEKCDN